MSSSKCKCLKCLKCAKVPKVERRAGTRILADKMFRLFAPQVFFPVSDRGSFSRTDINGPSARKIFPIKNRFSEVD